MITDAALSLCAKLRGELEEAQSRLRLAESELAKSRPSYSSSSKILFLQSSSNLIFQGYRSRHYDSSRLPTRSRPTYTTSYDLPISTSTYNYSKYDNDYDYDNILPSRYLSSALSSRYNTYSNYYY